MDVTICVLTLRQMINPMMINPLMPLPPQLSPALGPNPNGTSTSNSPTFKPMSNSPPNMFGIPQFGGNGPPPPQKFGIPSPTMPNLQFPRPNTSPSPPVSPLLTNMNVGGMPPFIPSPPMMQPPNGQMPHMSLNNPMLQFKNLNLNAAPKLGPTNPTAGGAGGGGGNGPQPQGQGNAGNPMLNSSRKSLNANQSNPTLSSSRKSEVMRPSNAGTAAQ